MTILLPLNIFTSPFVFPFNVDDTVKVMRGTWFYSSGAEPVEEVMANDIEKEHLDLFTRDNPPEPPAQPTKGAQKGTAMLLLILKSRRHM